MDLGVNPYFNVRTDIQLDSGRVISLKSLKQTLTYSGLMTGVPDKDANSHHISHTIAWEEHTPPYSKPWLINPDRRNFLTTPGDMKEFTKKNYIPEWLPSVECVGIFTSGPIKSGISELKIIWYQDEYALPIKESILKHIRQISWEELAKDSGH